MRIGELAQQVGVTTDTVRFYERSGWLPSAPRRENRYRDYDDADVEHLRLLIDLRRLDLPLEDAARIASWCHSGHCSDTTGALPQMIADRRAIVRERMERLRELDAHLAALQRHLGLPMLAAARTGGACCDAALAVIGSTEGSCACCAPVAATQGA
jgi:DNA-binding transcriptional MerR regulator